MRPIFIDSATVRAPERLIIRGGGWRMVELKVRYGFLHHATLGPILIDTGYSPRVCAGAERSFALKGYNAILGPRLIDENGVLPFLASRKINAQDVRTIIITHFHADHICALRDFANARFMLSQKVWEPYVKAGAFSNLRHGVFGELLPHDFANRMTFFEDMNLQSLVSPFEGGHDLLGDGSVISVNLPGHAAGHCGLMFTSGNAPFLYATDVQWLRQAVTKNRAPCFPATHIYDDAREAAKSTEMLRAFAASGGDFLLCHQPERHAYDLTEAPL